MPVEQGRRKSPLLPLRAVSGKFLSSQESAGNILNMVTTEEGTLACSVGPCPFIPDYGSGYPAYGTLHGIHHAIIGTYDQGGYSVLFLADGSSIKVWEGWNRSWRDLVTDFGGGGDLEVGLSDTTRPQYPMQFVSTPNGVVIVPQGGVRAMFYDGECVAFLGYSEAPSSPVGEGPWLLDVPSAPGNSPNYYGYSGDGPGFASQSPKAADIGKMYAGTARVDVQNPDSGGALLSSAYQSAVQWIDRWGNLSPIGPRSNTVTIDAEYIDTDVDASLHAFLWKGIATGPDATIGRLLLMTKDMYNSGTTDLFVASQNELGGVPGAWATIPDNMVTSFHWNQPDSVLISRSYEVAPVPIFKVATLGLGRLWIGGVVGDASVVRWSIPGRWGTFEKDGTLYPDPSGGEVTGLSPVEGAVLAFTARTTHLIKPADPGPGFVAATIRNDVGCVAPSSIQSTSAGGTIWLGSNGFYMFTGKGVEFISEDIAAVVRKINKSRALQATAIFDPVSQEYRCWVPVNGSQVNNFCFVFSMRTGGWAFRDTERPVSVCVTADPKRYTLFAGEANETATGWSNGVYVLERQNKGWVPAEKTCVVESVWLGTDIQQRKSPKCIHLWLRETRSANLTVSVYRDYRIDPETVYDGVAVATSQQDPPALWGTVTLGQADRPNRWHDRRLFWQRVDVALPDCEVFKVKVSATTPFEFVGMSIDDLPLGSSLREI